MTEAEMRFKSNELCPSCFSPTESHVSCPVCGYSQEEGAHDWNCLKAGTIIHGRYLIGLPLGHGGFGITYLGLDLNVNSKLAIKEYYPQIIAIRNTTSREVMSATKDAGETFRSGMYKFLEEARTLAQFGDHPHIVSVRDFFKENGTAYMVMTYLEGRTFLKYLEERGGKISFEDTMGILSPVMDALDQVHASGLIHRDISPDNIFVTDSGHVKLLDFGAAKSAMALINQQSHSVVLKRGYSPAEQYQSRGSLGPWTDVYSMAATIFRGITGSIPPDPMDRLDNETLVPPSRMGVVLPGHSEVALLNALALSSRERPQSMSEFKNALCGGGSGLLGRQSDFASKANTFKNDNQGPCFVNPGMQRIGKTLRQFLDTFVRETRKIATGAISCFQNIIGKMYQKGIFVVRNYDIAQIWFEEAAKRGNSFAMNNMGEMLCGGIGVEQDFSEAFKWFKKGAELGNPQAQNHLGDMLAQGLGVQENYAEAIKWYEKSSGNGNSNAQFNLGEIYSKGLGVNANDAEAYFWFYKAAIKGNGEAQFRIGNLFSKGAGVSQDDSQAMNWWRQAAKKGHPIAQYYLGVSLEKQERDKKKESKAFKWYMKSAIQGNLNAQCRLGLIYFQGRGVGKDCLRAVEWFLKSAEQGHVHAQNLLGMMWARGEGIPQDNAEAVKWFRLSADQGYPDAQYNLGLMYSKGQGVDQNNTEAAKWYLKAAEQGHPDAKFKLGSQTFGHI